MARGRMFDRSFLKSQKLNAIPRDHRLVYASILPFLDREGRIVAEPIYLKAIVFRWSDFEIDEIAEAVASLATIGLIHLYADEDNKAILEYVRFLDFNSPNKNEAKSELPGPDDDGAAEVRDESITTRMGDAHAMHVQSTEAADALPVENETKRNVEREDRTEAQADSPEARFHRLATTGTSEQAETARTRATIRRVAGPAFASKHEDAMPAWSRWTNDRLRDLWAAADPQRWPGEERKRREWIYVDLLNEDRHPQGPKPDHSALLKKYRGVEGEKDGKRFQVVGTDLNGELLLTDIAGYLTPQQVEEAHACLPN